MEEKKVVQMGKASKPSKTEDAAVAATEQRLSYEQLVNVANQLSQQNRELYQRLQTVTLENMFKRLEYLFKVLDASHHFDDEFVIKCSDEIVNIMTIPQEETPEEEADEEIGE